LYSQDRISELNPTKLISGVVWTKSILRLFVLVANALKNNEPVLLVGETGCGKTTVCQKLADAFDNLLYTVNAHQNTETGDLIGQQRPVRNRSAIEFELKHLLVQDITQATGVLVSEKSIAELLKEYSALTKSNLDAFVDSPNTTKIAELRTKFLALFEWSDGALVAAMKSGSYFLLDEISLADDSVLERMNSVLEPSRTMFLAEKGPFDSLVTATDGFQFLATMNPGGDYGKRELSPALRNRFTEIWVPPITDYEDITKIVVAKLNANTLNELVPPMIDFAQWFTSTYSTAATSSVSVRDMLACVDFMNFDEKVPLTRLFHALSMVYIDTLGANPAGLLSINSSSLAAERQKCIKKLSEILKYEEVFKLHAEDPLFNSTPKSF